MTRKTLRLLPLLALLLVVPGASAAADLTAQLTFEPGLRQVLFAQTLTGPDAAALRDQVDSDDDGRVTAEERATWETARTLDGARPCTQRPFNFTRVDGEPASWAFPYTYATADGVVGTVTSGDPIDLRVLLSVRSEAALRDGDRVTIEFGAIEDVSALWGCSFGNDLPLDLSVRPHAVFIEVDGVLVAPAALAPALVAGDGRGLQLDDPDEVALAYQHVIEFRYADPGGGLLAGFGDALGAIGLVAGGVALAGLAAALASAPTRARLARTLALGLVPLFSRLRKERVLDHERRERLYAYIRDHQGASFADLRRDLDIGSGSLAHHLAVLQGQGFVQPYRDGLRDRFYLRGPKVEPDGYLTRTQRTLLEVIRTHPGIAQQELARRVGLSRQSVQYHGKTLAEHGMVRAERVGRRLAYTAAGADAAPA